MTWSYSGDPSTSKKDEVRFLIGDTDQDDQLLQDEEIEYLLSVESNVYRAASKAARSIAAKFSREAEKSIGDYSIKANQRAEAYKRLMKDLEEEGKKKMSFAGKPYAGGIRLSDKEKDRTNKDMVQPRFRKGFMDNSRY